MLSLSGHSWNPAATWAVEGKALTALQGSSPGAGNADSGRGAYSTCRLRPVAGRAGLGRPPGVDTSVLSGALLVSLGGPPTLSGLQDSSASRTSPVGECVWGGLSRWCWAGPWGRPLQVSASATILSCAPPRCPRVGWGLCPRSLPWLLAHVCPQRAASPWTGWSVRPPFRTLLAHRSHTSAPRCPGLGPGLQQGVHCPPPPPRPMQPIPPSQRARVPAGIPHPRLPSGASFSSRRVSQIRVAGCAGVGQGLSTEAAGPSRWGRGFRATSARPWALP